MRIHKIKILFVISSSRKRLDGKSILYCRITYTKQREQFSTGLFIHPSSWDSKKQIIKPPNDENDIINTQLSLIKNKIHQAFLSLQFQQNSFTLHDIYCTYRGDKLARDYNAIEYI